MMPNRLQAGAVRAHSKTHIMTLVHSYRAGLSSTVGMPVEVNQTALGPAMLDSHAPSGRLFTLTSVTMSLCRVARK